MRRLPLFITATLALTAFAHAQQAGVTLRFDSTNLEVGEIADGQLVCTNIGQPDAPQLVAPAGLSVTIANSSPSSSSVMRVINGRRTQEVTYTYPVRVQGSKEGKFVLGPVEVSAGGQTHVSNAVQFNIRTPETKPIPDGDRYIFASIDVKPRSLYLTETFEATLRFGIRKVLDRNNRTIDIDMLRNVLDLRSSELSVFAGGNAPRTETSLKDSAGRVHRYELFTVTKTLRADKAGDMTIGPVFLKANYPTDLRASFFGNFEVVSSRKETARTESIVVKVKSPPDEGRPDSFNGAIGRFAMRVEAKPTRVEEGQPVTLTIRIVGEPLEGIAGPELSRQAELSSRFEFATDELAGDIEGNNKVFRRAIFPKQVGEQTIPPIAWSYFDTKTESYGTLTSEPIAIVVDPSSSPDKVASRLNSLEGEEKTELTLLTGGLTPNYEDTDRVLANHGFIMTPPWIAALSATPVFYCALLLITRHQSKIRGDRGYARRRHAETKAIRAIRQADTSSNDAARLASISQALRHYLADKFNLTSGAVTSMDVERVLRERGIDNQVTQSVIQFLEAGDAAQYANVTAGDANPSGAKQAEELIRAMERTIR